MRPFGCPVTILNTIDYLGKFDGMADEGFFVGYSLNKKAFRVFNSRTRIVEENLHIRFSESTPNVVGSGPNWLFDIDALTRTMNYEPIVAGTHSNGFIGTKDLESVQKYIFLPLWNADPPFSQDPKSSQDNGLSHPRTESESEDQERGNTVSSTNNVNTASTNEVNTADRISSIKLPNDPNMSSLDDNSIFDYSHNEGVVIGDLQATITTRRMSQSVEEHGRTQEGSLRIRRSKLDRSYAGRASTIQVVRSLDFDRVYKVEKALYGLRKASRAWYETLSTYLLNNRFHRGKINKTLFIKRHKGDILLVQVYVGDIIFGSTKKELCTKFENLMHEKFQMSSMGELTFFLGLQVKQKNDGIFINQDKYVAEILKKFDYKDVRIASTLMDIEKALLKDSDGDDVDVHLYRSMIGSLMYLTSSRPDIMFACKKQTVVATSTTEAEYVAAASCCRQVLWIHNQMLDYRLSILRPNVKSFTSKVWFEGRQSCVNMKSSMDGKICAIKRGQDTKIPQSGGPSIKVGDEAVYNELGDKMKWAATIASRLGAEQNSDAQNRFEAASKSLMTHLSQEVTRLEVGRTA
ncbi:putative ribonuclease H-like domain-containing protein [Tanacetum coccineum]